jgi:hypothetical protein
MVRQRHLNKSQGRAYAKSILYNGCCYHDLARDVLVAIYCILPKDEQGYGG